LNGLRVSKGAREAIEAAGGTIVEAEVVEPSKKKKKG